MGIKIYKDGAQVTNMPAVGRPIASQAEAEAGTNNTKQMTPLRVAQAIAELGGAGGSVEIVTEEYTGEGDAIEVVGEAGSELGAGAFASLASQAEAEAGTNNTKMMTPLRTAQAITELGSGGGSGTFDQVWVWAFT